MCTCICDCGNEICISEVSLTKAHPKTSCGCANNYKYEQKQCLCGRNFIATHRQVNCDICTNESSLISDQENRRKLKREVFDAYGGICACCGNSDWRFLSIDHIDNSGAKHRKQLFGTKGTKSAGGGGHGFYLYLKRNMFPQGNYQVLCFNCNMAKEIFGVCPHNDDTVGAMTVKPKTNYKPGPQDQCQTPGYALDPLLPYLPQGSAIWEPAAGEGLLVRSLERRGYSVLASDLLTGNDFYYTECSGADYVVSNPPYSQKPQFIRRCYELKIPFALLVPVETIGSGKVQRMMKQYGAEILLLDKRINFKMPNLGFEGSGAQFPVLWFCHNILPSPICLGEINYYDEPDPLPEPTYTEYDFSEVPEE